MTRYGVVFLLLLTVQSLRAEPARIILLRHAEKPADESDVHLSARGQERARALVAFFTNTPVLTTNGLPVALFATHPTPHGHSQRTFDTLEPLSKQLHLPVRTPYATKDYVALAKQIRSNRDYDGKTVVVCWVHDYLPELAEAFGVKPKPAHWKTGVFDRVWVITRRDKKAVLASLPQHLLPGDSRR